ncbi:PREDICTED: receptor-like protein 12 isoform X1 [Fragaria vesca subsp. vesca]|uniref:receptor-like protein 12 isoform X1 n=2 Tax=Fragaria vesca subsp. vesca TaxID=101020 RepID=UPI0002C30917|nr:PREDICTED: receptor-like protein 12 isoform X1 [Fragaria vesca subsp. vesca]
MKTLMSFFLSLIVAVHSQQCLKDQQLNLLDFKNSLLFNASLSSKLVSWDSRTDCCSWPGVSCSTNGSVVGLDISRESISGGIYNSSSLFDLQHLQSLSLAFNNFTGSQIPSATGKLTSLRYLNLSSAGFGGQIPIEISLLGKLVILDISYNQGLEIQDLSMLIQNLTELTELYLDNVSILSQTSDWSLAISSSLPNLKVLSLSNCHLSGPIDKSLAKLSSLSVIRLDLNKISSPIPGFFANFANLTTLSLRSCGLQGTFPKEIIQVPSLQTIDLSYNYGLGGSLPEFSKNASLQSLNLYVTNFSGVLPDSIGNLNMLSTINLSGCKFSGSIPRAMGNLTKLVHFDLSGNQFNGSIPCFSSAKNLAEINLYANDLTGHIGCTQWQNLTSLVSINLGSNVFQGSLPSSLFCLPLLKSLNLGHNQFSGQFPEICNASSYLMESVDLSDNNLEGPIPMSIFNLLGLKELLLNSNSLNGSFPLDGLHQLINLEILYLQENSLVLSYDATNSSYSSFPQLYQLKLASGKLTTFPDFLRNQSGLAFLDLSNNLLHGMIPNWIWKLNLYQLNLSCNSLQTIEGPLLNVTSPVFLLDLSYNKLQGQIPDFSSYYLDYSSNNFSSGIPTGADFCRYTSFFSAANNNLSGIIPGSICNSASLEVLDLSNNSFTGTLPQCFTTMSGLAVLDLSGNNVTNVVIPQNCNLGSLDLSGNQLESQLPKSLANCTKLEVLNLGNNQITDAFPCFLKNISTLRLLSLRSNNFYGSSVCPKTNGGWPMLQIIDLADNNFEGEISGSFLSTWQTMIANEDNAARYRYHLGMQGGMRYVINYKDAVTVTSKGLQMNLPSILTVFTLIDFSCNKFNGSIPEEIGGLKSLRVLNLSKNAFTGAIPSSLSSLQVVESLDLSQNKLSGEIPPQFAKLTFLTVLNLSNNQLVGRIPTSTQFSTFPKSSFQGNIDLWGPPLTEDNIAGTSPPIVGGSRQTSGHEVDWDVISVEIGFAAGFGVAIASLFLCKRWRQWYYITMYKILLKIFPQLEQRFGNHRRHVSIHQRYGRR